MPQADPIIPPDSFCYTESSLFGGLREIRSNADLLTCTACQGSEGQAWSAIRLPQRAWRRLWELFEELEVWTWSGRYENPEILDGVSWALDVTWGPRKVEASGYHAWPGRGRDFERMLILLRRLAKGEPAGWVAGRASLV